MSLEEFRNRLKEFGRKITIDTDTEDQALMAYIVSTPPRDIYLKLRRLRRLAREAISLAEEVNGHESSCSYNVPIGERLKELRKEVAK